jgi:DmsE family decaheme c-type cytochrome
MRSTFIAALVGLFLFGPFSPTWAADAAAAAKCVKCHDSEDLPDMSRTAHGFSADKRAPDCTSCHGTSAAHAKKPSGTHPDRVFIRENASPAQDRSAACLTCHTKDANRALWSGSQHQNADVACNDCHKVHVNRDKILVKATQPDACYTCHKTQRIDMNKPSHHPVAEGKMACSDCHNPHGSAGPKLMKRDSINDTCYTCHAEKRGPFVHPHDPAAEDCSTCHNAHGTIVPAMLKSRPPLLCQQCHTPHTAGGLGALGGQLGVNVPRAGVAGDTSGISSVSVWQGRSCMNCHTQVHGSNNPSSTTTAPQSLMR